MDHHDCNHANCEISSTNTSVHQTISEMDWERGIWNAAFNGEEDKIRSMIDKARDTKQMVNVPDNSGYTALHYAARRGHNDLCKLLIQNGANVNAVTHGLATPLHKAASAGAGKSSTVQLLLQFGADIKMVDADGETILHKAVNSNNNELVQYLLQEYPDLGLIRDNKGQLPAFIN